MEETIRDIIFCSRPLAPKNLSIKTYLYSNCLLLRCHSSSLLITTSRLYSLVMRCFSKIWWFHKLTYKLVTLSNLIRIASHLQLPHCLVPITLLPLRQLLGRAWTALSNNSWFRPNRYPLRLNRHTLRGIRQELFWGSGRTTVSHARSLRYPVCRISLIEINRTWILNTQYCSPFHSSRCIVRSNATLRFKSLELLNSNNSHQYSSFATHLSNHNLT